MENMRKIIVLLLSMVMLLLVSCEDNSQTESEMEFAYDFGEYAWGYEFSESEEETEPEYDYLIDIFEDVEDWLTFSGAGNECSIQLDIPDDYSREINGLYIKKNWYANVVQLIYNNKLMGDFSFCFDSDYNLTAGDVVTIYDNDIRELNNNLLQNGFYIKDTEYQFNYPDIGSYIKSWEEAVNIFSVLDEKAKEYYCERENIDINSKEAENVTVPLFCGVYGEIKPDEVLNSEKYRVMVAVPVCEKNTYGYYYYNIVYMSGIVIESKELSEGEFYSVDDVRIEFDNIWTLNTNGYSELIDAVYEAATKQYDEYEWHK